MDLLERLCDVALEGDVTTLHQLLGQDRLVLDKAALKCPDKNPLHIAAMLGHVEFVKAVLQVQSAYFLCLARDREGRNPIHLAVIYGRLTVLQVLLDAGFEAPLEKTDGEETILHLCVKYNQLEALKMLVNRLKDRQFLNARSEDAAYFLCLARDGNGRNPIHLAAMYGRWAVLQVLLDAGFQAAMEKTDEGETILHLCVKYNQLDALKMLVNRLKDRQFPNARSEDAAYFLCLARDGNGRNPIHLAAMYGRLAVLQVLLDAGFQAALETTDEGGTILHLCVKYNQLDALKMLVDITKDVWFQNAKNKDGMNILHMAIYYRQNETIKYLLDSSQVWVKQQDAKGRNALSLLRGQANINTEIESSLRLIGARAGGHDPEEYQVMLKERSNAMMVVLSLIATMAFQAAVSPPGGVWQDDLKEGPNPHRVGEPIMAQTHPTYYRYLIRASTVTFVSSLSAIVLLIRGSAMHRSRAWHLMRLLSYLMGLAIATVSLTYAISLVALAPKHTRGDQLSNTVVIVLIVVTTFSSSIRPVTRCLSRLGHYLNIIRYQVFNFTHSLPHISTNA